MRVVSNLSMQRIFTKIAPTKKYSKRNVGVQKSCRRDNPAKVQSNSAKFGRVPNLCAFAGAVGNTPQRKFFRPCRSPAPLRRALCLSAPSTRKRTWYRWRIGAPLPHNFHKLKLCGHSIRPRRRINAQDSVAYCIKWNRHRTKSRFCKWYQLKFNRVYPKQIFSTVVNFIYANRGGRSGTL